MFTSSNISHLGDLLISHLMRYTILMDSLEKSKSREWLNNYEERNKRLGELGLSEDQKYSGLSDEERQYLNMDDTERKKIGRSYCLFQDNRDIPLEDFDKNKRPYINAFMGWYNILSDSITSPNDQYTQQLNIALTDAVLNLDIPSEKIRKIILMMSESDTPNFAKQMVSFKIQHPIDKLSDEFKDSETERSLSSGGGTEYRIIQSPILSKTIFNNHEIKGKYGEYGTEEIIYRDLLKCAFESSGKNIEQFLDKLSGGEYMMRAIIRWQDSDEPIGKYYSEKDLNDFQTLIRQLHSMHYQTKKGEKEEYDSSLHNKYKDYGKRTIAQVKSEIRTIYDEYQPNKRNSLGDRVVQSFCYPLGINSISEAYDYIENSKMNSFFRHRKILQNGEIGKVRKGDIVKSIISSNYLPYILENGVLSKEYLGIGEASDCTPLDTDVSIILEEPEDLRDAISKTSAAAFSAMGGATDQHFYGSEENIFLVFRNDERFKKYDNVVTIFDEDKYEICGYGGGNVIKNPDVDDMEQYDEYWYTDDRGIRTGIPSSEIDYIATDEKSAQKVIDAVKESGLYIPVTDLDGSLIFNPFK